MTKRVTIKVRPETGTGAAGAADELDYSFKKMAVKEKAVTYERVSSSMQEDGYSHDAQRDVAMEYAKQNNFNVTGNIRKTGTAWKSKAKTFKSLLEFVCNKDNNGMNLIVQHSDRLSRNWVDFANIVENSHKNNITLHDAHNNLRSSDSNDLEKMISFVLNGERESGNISRRVRSYRNYCRANRIKIMPSITKYGNDAVRDKQTGKIKKIVKNPGHQKVISLINLLYHGTKVQIVEGLLNEITKAKIPHRIFDYKNPDIQIDEIKPGNFTGTSIASFLNENNILRAGKKWTPSYILNILNSN
jgi:DNA invertase Pin-like site-specific DNA recombinase